MDISLKISTYIQSILSESQEILDIVGSDTHKIFPLLQPDNLQFPFIVHSRTGINATYTKDLEIGQFGWYNTVTYTVSCVSDDYDQCINLACAVRHSLEGYRWRTQDIYIHPIQFLSAAEYTTDNDAFVEELQFQIMVE